MSDYIYQHIIDNSQPLTVSRPVNVKSLKELVEALNSLIERLEESPEPTIDWTFVCSPPERFFDKRSNAPAYIPKLPTAAEFAEWLAWQGVKQTIEASHRKLSEYSRVQDKECRSANLEKFDDETFINKVTWINDESTKQQLEEERDAIIVAFAQGKDPNGNPITPESTQEICRKLKQISDRIKAKSKTSES